MKKRTKTNIILLICVILLVLIPFIFVKGEYGGSDDQGTEQIKKFDPHYKVWAHPVSTPPSGGVICYFIGVAHGKKKARENSKNNGKQQVTGK